jgi:hypothetical protein
MLGFVGPGERVAGATCLPVGGGRARSAAPVESVAHARGEWPR